MVNIKCTLKYICVRVVPKRSYYKLQCMYISFQALSMLFVRNWQYTNDHLIKVKRFCLLDI